MKISALVIWGAAFAALSVGCGEKVAIKVDPPKVPVAVIETPRAEPVVVVETKKPVLLGLPLTGGQIDVLGDIEFDTSAATIRQTPQTLGVLNTLATAGRAY